MVGDCARGAAVESVDPNGRVASMNCIYVDEKDIIWHRQEDGFVVAGVGQEIVGVVTRKL